MSNKSPSTFGLSCLPAPSLPALVGWILDIQMIPSKLVILVLLLAMATALHAADWSTFRGNQQRTGFSNEKVGIPMGGPIWKTALGCTLVSSPSIVDNTLYIGGRDSSLYAINTKTGHAKWKKRTGGWIDSSPLIYRGMLFVGTRNEEIRVFDKQTGDSLWSMCAGLQLSSPGIANETTIISGLGPPMNGFGAFSWSQMNAKWSFDSRQITYSSPAVSGSTAVIGANNGKLYGINLAKEDTIWSLATQGGIYLSTPAIDDTVTYLSPGNYDGHVYAVGTVDGQVRWKAAGTPVYESAKRIAAKNRIHPISFMQLLRLSPKRRSQIIGKLEKRGIAVPGLMKKMNSKKADSLHYINDFYSYGGIKTSSVAVGPENVYVIQKELGFPKPRFSLIALNKQTGKEAWYFAELRNSEKLGYCSSPVVADGKVFFGWGEGRVYALSAQTGKMLWQDSLQGNIISSPAISNGKLYVASYDGILYAYDLLDTPMPLDFNDGTYCYPNPASTQSCIQFFPEKAGDIEVRIYDFAERLIEVYRKKILSASVKDEFCWNLNSAANGVYFAIVKTDYDDGTMDRKIIKIAVVK